MYLPIPNWLVFLFLGIASFAPMASAWPGWWMVYYSTLLACWVLVSVVAVRRVALQERRAKLKLARMVRKDRGARTQDSRLDAAALEPRRRLSLPTNAVSRGT